MITLPANVGVVGSRLQYPNGLRSTNNSRSVSSSVVGSQQNPLSLPSSLSPSKTFSRIFNATYPPSSSFSQYQNSESPGILQAISAFGEIMIGILSLVGLFGLGQQTSGLFRGRKA